VKQSFELLALRTGLNRLHPVQDALRVRRKNFLEQSVLSRNRLYMLERDRPIAVVSSSIDDAA
jgi:hypothetical protein